jgi:hypothetical protein
MEASKRIQQQAFVSVTMNLAVINNKEYLISLITSYSSSLLVGGSTLSW